jgi:hypothetical protein
VSPWLVESWPDKRHRLWEFLEDHPAEIHASPRFWPPMIDAIRDLTTVRMRRAEQSRRLHAK